MYGEIDLELYTLAIIKLNTAFEKLKENSQINEVKLILEDSFKDLNKFYHDIIDDLKQDEINLNEHYLFFQNGKQVFPQYIEALGNIENEDLEYIIGPLMNIFNNLNKISEGFSVNGLYDMN